MLNYIWLSLVILSVIIGGATNRLDEVVKSAFDTAKVAVMDIALPLTAVMAIWLGIMRLAEKAGLIQILSRALRPVLRWLFPDVPADHPAMGCMVMNIAANMLGLGNAATPLGIRAMAELQKLNPHPGTATNAMCTFLAICTASIQLIPATAVGILAVNHGKNPTAIVGPAFIATMIAQIVGIVAVKSLQNWPIFRATPDTTTTTEAISAKPLEPMIEAPRLPELAFNAKLILITFFSFFVLLFINMSFPEVFARHLPHPDYTAGKIFSRVVNAISILAIPFFLSFFALYAALRKIKVYEEFVEGAKEGFNVAVRIIPFLVTILTAVAMFRGANGIKLMGDALKPLLDIVQFPPELLSLAFMRPLSGSGSLALFTDIVKQFGPDHLFSMMAGTMYGSTETTFFVIAVYFGSVGIRRTRHAIAAGLLADFAGMVASVIICRIMFG